MGRYVANELNLLFPPSKTSFRLSQKIILFSTLPSDGSYVATTQILTFSNLNLTFRLLVLTHTKSTIALYHNSLIRIANPSIPLSFLSTATHTFHTTPLIFTVSFHLCFSHSEQIKFALSKYIHHLSLLNIYSSDISYTDKIHTFSPKDRRALTAITTFSEACISIPGKR